MQPLRSITPLLALALLPLAGACIIVVHDDGSEQRPRTTGESGAQAALVPGEHEDVHGLERLADLRQRLTILRSAQSVLATEGKQDCATMVQQGVRVGELQLEGASADAIQAEFEGLTMEQLIACLDVAGESTWCATCKQGFAALSAYYVEREGAAD